ncbi:M16 family metallopeptidase [Roseibium limicola]|uniref:Insulinase family protein n=1 Tax=Roseibium limicola TaxID=2816037 RepID=A0A939EN81_9HYPH|nr:pitrilysin family protein [Roseibium limicola]MBO0345850.1 insulinase family protein [Roseibium limicola]
MSVTAFLKPLVTATAFLGAALSTAQAVEIQKVTSPGGIEAWLVEDHTIPLIAMNFSFEGGAAQDPEDKQGLTRLLAATLDEGAGDLSSQAFQARLEELSVTLRYDTGKDYFYGTLRTLTANRDEAFNLAEMSLNKPRFDEEPVQRMKTQFIAGIRQSEQDPSEKASDLLYSSLLGDHPYTWKTEGTVESQGSLTPDDLRTQYQKLLAKDGVTIGVVGDIDAATLAPALDKIFGGLPEKADLTPVADLIVSSGKTVSAEMNVPQTQILFGLPGIMRDDPDYQAAYVMNHILGGGSFTSWLYEEVREKRGLTYGVGTSLAPYNAGGLMIGSAATRADKADESVQVIQEQFKRMTEQGPTQAELDSAKKYLTGSYALRFDSSAKIARQLVALQNADLGIDYFERRNAEIEAVTLDDVKKAAQRLLGDKTPTIALVGPKMTKKDASGG